MKLISWNINGIRAAVKKGFVDFLQTEKPDILCLQEIKISDSSRNEEVFDFAGYREFWHSAVKPGYAGTMTLVKDGIKVLGEEKFIGDSEGRVQVLEFAKFYLCNIYFVNAQRGLTRLKFKLEWEDRLLKFLKKLDKKKPLVICGDFNVAREEIDIARPKENQKNAGFTAEERGWMSKFLAAGFVDVFRQQHPDKVQYTWWLYYANARARNIGWRIDYFCVSWYLFKLVKRSFILDQIQGSDHCPVGIEFE
ncbi:MAG TPA: exodeoxyribonuclease III [Candidatus Nanoarchaeia archaeon]|nr:exodeoxyribonuclease III [Candidatus Nanoarchaeia archaeon]